MDKNLVWDDKLKRGFFDIRALLSLCIMVFTPPLVFLLNYSIFVDDGEIFTTVNSFIKGEGNWVLIKQLYDISVDNWMPVKLYVCWIVYTFLMAKFFPGKTYKGGITQGGNCLDYKCNGFNVYVFTVVLFLFLVFFDFIDGTIVARYFPPSFVLSCSFGFFMTVFSYVKGRLFPTHPEDVRLSGNFVHDLFSGIELNPRLFGVDFKLFFNARTGICLWTLINISFMLMQYNKFGFVTKGMWLVNYLHFLYVVDYFYNEAWYLKTIDIQTDSFGFYLAWGDLSWLPFMYTLQSQYLAVNPVEISWPLTLLLFFLGTFAYVGFRLANEQKQRFKDSNGNCSIWWKEATFIPSTFRTGDGKVHSGKLMTCGWWGVCRRINYTFDIIGSFCYCACTGFNDIIPWFYFIYLTILLVHRLRRDDLRLRAKYGDSWKAYKKQVKYWLIPYVI